MTETLNQSATLAGPLILKSKEDLEIVRTDGKVVGIVPANTCVTTYAHKELEDSRIKMQVDLSGNCFIYLKSSNSIDPSDEVPYELIAADFTLEQIQTEKITPVSGACRCIVKSGKLLYGPADYFSSFRNASMGEKFQADYIYDGYVHVTKNKVDGFISVNSVEFENKTQVPASNSVPTDPVSDKVAAVDDESRIQSVTNTNIKKEEVSDLDCVIAILVDTEEKEDRLMHFLKTDSMIPEFTTRIIEKGDYDGWFRLKSYISTLENVSYKHYAFIETTDDELLYLKLHLLTKGFKPMIYTI